MTDDAGHDAPEETDEAALDDGAGLFSDPYEGSDAPADPLRGFSFGELFHMALRKACDSGTAKLAWTLVHVLPQPVWRDFIAHASREIGIAGDITPSVLRQSCLSWEWYCEPSGALKFDDEGRRIGKVWRLALELPSDDWQPIAAFMKQCVRADGGAEDDPAGGLRLDSGTWDSGHLALIEEDLRGAKPRWEFATRAGTVVARLGRKITRHDAGAPECVTWTLAMPGFRFEDGRSFREVSGPEEAISLASRLVGEGLRARHSERPAD